MIQPGITDSYALELYRGVHREADRYQIALYTEQATLSRETTAYTREGEVSPSGDYVPGGQALQRFRASLIDGVACLEWTVHPTWKQVTCATRGALIYNATRGGASVAVLDFGAVVTATRGRFTVVLPPSGSTTALIRSV